MISEVFTFQTEHLTSPALLLDLHIRKGETNTINSVANTTERALIYGFDKVLLTLKHIKLFYN